jgi:hypothetical protein
MKRLILQAFFLKISICCAVQNIENDEISGTVFDTDEKDCKPVML